MLTIKFKNSFSGDVKVSLFALDCPYKTETVQLNQGTKNLSRQQDEMKLLSLSQCQGKILQASKLQCFTLITCWQKVNSQYSHSIIHPCHLTTGQQ